MIDVPPISLSPVAGVIVNVVAWAVFHSATGYAVHRMPLSWLRRDVGILRHRAFEREGRWYERCKIRRWKDTLPEAGALFAGGVSKKRLPSTTAAGLSRYAAETRRAEWGHWAAMACGPVFVLWNRPAIAVLMVAYGVLVNAPFIAIQRYNRWRIGRILARTSSSSSPPSAS